MAVPVFSEVEFDALLTDPSKTIDGDIYWGIDADHVLSLEFRAPVSTPQGYPLFVKGSLNQAAGTLTFTLINPSIGRIYGLDLGKSHRNPDRSVVGDKHKHRWKDSTRDKFAYEPPDITATVAAPVDVWTQFCVEASITHNGQLHLPPAADQLPLFHAN